MQLSCGQVVPEKVETSSAGVNSGDLSDISASGGERSRRSRQLASLSIADVSPRLALQRILALFQVYPY